MVKFSQKRLPGGSLGLPGRNRRLPGENLRFPLIVLTAFLVLAAVFAEGFVFTHLDHDCIGEQCSVCLQIEIAQCLLEGLGRIGILALAACLFPQIFVIIKNRLFFAVVPQTLVSLKIKYNS